MIQHKKNTAYYLSFPAVNSSTPESFATGLSPVDTAYYKDGAGAWTALPITDTATEIASTGTYEIDLSASEMNHDKVLVKFAVSGMADTAFLFDMTAQNIDDVSTQVSVDDIPTNAEFNARTILSANYATSANQTTINGHLTDIKGTGFVLDTHSLPQCVTATGFSTFDHTADNVTIGAYAAGQHPWDAARNAHTTNNTFGGTVNKLHDLVGNDFAVSDASPTQTVFTTTLPVLADDAYLGLDIYFINGSANPPYITKTVYSSTTVGGLTQLTFDEAFPVTVSNGDSFVANVAAGHEHTSTETAETIRAEMDTNSTKLDVAVGTRASQTSVDDVPTNAEFNARTLPSAEYATENNVNANETKIDTVITNLVTVDNNVDSLISGVVANGVAGTFPAHMVDSVGNAVASEAVTVYVAKDSGAYALAAGTATTTDSDGRTVVSYAAADVTVTGCVSFKLMSATALDNKLDFKVS